MTTPERDEDAQHTLTPTGRVILGMIALGKRTGYDIKQLVDKSTRHFWAASYGQIYPELRRLEEQGLVEGRSEPTGGRARMVYELTPAGHAALRGWLQSTAEPTIEFRNEAMLKLFFSDLGTPEERIEQLRVARAFHERTLDQLYAIEHVAADGVKGPYMTLEMGIGLHRWIVDYLEATERRLAAETEKE
jgi:DNA-binding PadR family transcriptional regulator